MPRSVPRADLIRAIKGSIGRLDGDGNEILDEDETTPGAQVANEQRPSRERIHEISVRMAEIDAQKRRRHRGD